MLLGHLAANLLVFEEMAAGELCGDRRRPGKDRGGRRQPAGLRQYRSNDKANGLENGPDRSSDGRRRVSQVVSFYESRAKLAGLLGNTGADSIPRMALQARALLLAIDAINWRWRGNRKPKRRRQTERDCAQSQVPNWARPFIHLLHHIQKR